MIDEQPRLRAEAQFIAEFVVRTLDERWPDKTTHHDHHRWAAEQILLQSDTAGRRRRLIDYIMGSAIVGVIGWIGFVVLRHLGAGGS